MFKRIGVIIISIAVAVSMMPATCFAAKSGANINIYAIYMTRDDGKAVSSDRYGDAVLIESNGKYLLMDTGSITPIKKSRTCSVKTPSRGRYSLAPSRLSPRH